MAEELSYVIINPYTIYKSRTGGVLARLLTRTSLDLVGAQMFAPSQALIDEYSKHIVTETEDDSNQQIQELIRDYVRENLNPDPITGQRERVLILLFKGENAIRRVREAVGTFRRNFLGGESIRDTYGDIVYNRDGSVRYFEPAVLASANLEETQRMLRIWAKFSEADGGVLDKMSPTTGEARHERTLVIIKPDNFKFPSGRPGNIMDIFSRTGLIITGIKVHRMSVAEGEAFYGPIREMLRERFAMQVGEKAKELLGGALNLNISPETQEQIGKLLGPQAGDQQFNTIVKFMTGHSTDEVTEEEKNRPGTQKCIILIYEGMDAVRKIREVLGPTDPSKAPSGTIRREFGSTIMVNAAHASDSPENARREMDIVKIRENDFANIVHSFYQE
jgi:nucleoside diphosphate kinase